MVEMTFKNKPIISKSYVPSIFWNKIMIPDLGPRD